MWGTGRFQQVVSAYISTFAWQAEFQLSRPGWHAGRAWNRLAASLSLSLPPSAKSPHNLLSPTEPSKKVRGCLSKTSLCWFHQADCRLHNAGFAAKGRGTEEAGQNLEGQSPTYPPTLSVYLLNFPSYLELTSLRRTY